MAICTFRILRNNDSDSYNSCCPLRPELGSHLQIAFPLDVKEQRVYSRTNQISPVAFSPPTPASTSLREKGFLLVPRAQHSLILSQFLSSGFIGKVDSDEIQFPV